MSARLDELLATLDAAREDFTDALADVDAELATVPGVQGEWSVRDLVVHLAAWNEHAARAMELAAAGRPGAFEPLGSAVDDVNERLLAEASATSPGDALRREEASYRAFRERLAAIDPRRLDDVMGNGDTLEAIVGYDGADHYREHTDHLRAWFGVGEDDEAS